MKTYRQSALQNYLGCNRSFKHRDFQTPPSQAMINGLIFEGFVFGFKTEEEKAELTLTKAGKPKAGIAKYERLAEFVKPYFGIGVHHQRMIHRVSDEYSLSFEPDYYGCFAPEQKDFKEAVVDLKLTANISKIWDWKQSKQDFFQACSYTWAVLQETGNRLPFYYLVVEDNDYEIPVCRIIEVKVSDNDLKWFLSVAERAHKDIFLEPNAEACLGNGRFDPRCRCLEKCDFGRDKVGGFEVITFDDLKCDMEIPIIEDQDWSELGKKKKKVFNEEFLAKEVELKETVIEYLDFKELTYYRSEISNSQNGAVLCRNCRKGSIAADDKECVVCNTKINWLEG